jgi:hypothetical protein
LARKIGKQAQRCTGFGHVPDIVHMTVGASRQHLLASSPIRRRFSAAGRVAPWRYENIPGTLLSMRVLCRAFSGWQAFTVGQVT